MLSVLGLVQMQALDNLHQERSHRDMKAGNVMVSGWDNPTGLRIHLIDWANSRLHSEGKEERTVDKFVCILLLQILLRQQCLSLCINLDC